MQRGIQKVIEGIKAGFELTELKPEMGALVARKASLTAQLAVVDEPLPRLHPAVADVYRSKVEQLVAALEMATSRARPERRSAASSTGS